MRIHSLSMVLYLPLIIIAIAIVYYSKVYDRDASIYVFIPVILAVAAYVFSGPLDHWWRTKYPLKLDEPIINWLNKYFLPYSKYSESQRTKFEERLTLYIEGRLFQAVGLEMGEVPYDFKAMIAAHGVNMAMGFDDYLIGDVDRIYIYKHPFPSPKFHRLHSVEVDHEDGVIIINTEQLTNSVIYPDDYYNVAYHAYAESMISVHKMRNLPNTWEDLPLVNGFTRELIEQQVGIPIENPAAVHVSLFYTNPESYKALAPKHFDSIVKAFKYVSYG
jgi:hypothetical protein